MGERGRRREGAHPRRRHLPGGARAALRSRRTGRSVRRVPRAAAREPVAVHVLPASSRGDDRRLVARADGAAARRPRDQPPDRRDPAPRPRRAARPAARRRARRASEGARRARDARRPRAQRRRPRRAVRHRARRGADDARALLARHAPDEPGRGRPRARQGRRSTCCARRSRPARSAARPKVRAMEIIDELEPTKRGPYAGVVGYVDFSGNLDTAIAIRTMVWRDGQATLQAGAGIVADSDPADEDLECRNKAQALLTAAAAAAQRLPPTRMPTFEDHHERRFAASTSTRCRRRLRPRRDARSCRACCRRTSIRSPSARARPRCCCSRRASSSRRSTPLRVDDDGWWCVSDEGGAARRSPTG